jgi:hypothetical protein
MLPWARSIVDRAFSVDEKEYEVPLVLCHCDLKLVERVVSASTHDQPRQPLPG